MDDLISRQAAIDAIKNTYGLSYIEDGFNRQDAVSILENLPSAQPEPCEDAVSRQWLLDEYDKRHKGQAGGARKIIEEAPSVHSEHYGDCTGCKHQPRFSREEPCVYCSNNYENKWSQKNG